MFLATNKQRARLELLDVLRGAAIALMVLDHALVQVAPQHWLRYSLTRLSLPLFVGVAASVPGRSWSLRTRKLLLVGVCAEVAFNPSLGLALPGPVLLIALVLPLERWLWRHNAAAVGGVLGLVQALYLPVPWAGYQPGLVLAWAVLGGMAVRELAYRHDLRDRSVPGLSALGRSPIHAYVLHLVALAAVFR